MPKRGESSLLDADDERIVYEAVMTLTALAMRARQLGLNELQAFCLEAVDAAKTAAEMALEHDRTDV